jgi:hypothetical protein
VTLPPPTPSADVRPAPATSRTDASLVTLLRAIAADRADLTLAGFREAQIRWAVTAGLGPWLKRCTAADPDAERSPFWPLVHGADLTARIVVAEQLDAAEEIIDACEPYAPPITLLKGISMCDQYYPEPHLRTMGDIDLLVDEVHLDEIEARLRTLGYRPESSKPPSFYETHHHACPMFHPGRRVWVELHRDLFPPSSPLSEDPVFTRDSVRGARVPATFRGRRVWRLGDEVQLMYIATHWAFGMRRRSGIVGIVDAMCLFKHASTRQWDRLLTGRDGLREAASHVYLLLTYLHRHQLAETDPKILARLFRRQRSLGPTTLRILHTLMDHYVVDGRSLWPLMSTRNFGITWTTLLSPAPPSRNLMTLARELLPSPRSLLSAILPSPRAG